MNYDWILKLFMGALIGYCTNWLAIKMLFKPHTEKKLFGMRIPFTPGVIPKERRRMASKIGEVIEAYLLTDQLIVDELSSEVTTRTVTTFIESNLYNEAGAIDLSRVKVLLDQNPKLYQQLDLALQEKVAQELLKPETKKAVIDHLSPSLIDYLKGIEAKTLIGSSETLHQAINDFVMGDSFSHLVSGKIHQLIDEDKKLSDLMPESMTQMIHTTLRMNTLQIMDEIRRTVALDTLRERIVPMIEQVVHEKVGGLGAMFINASDVYTSIVQKVDETLDQQEYQTLIMDFIINKVDHLTEKQLFEVIPNHMLESTMDQATAAIQKALSDPKGLDQLIEGYDGTLYDLVNHLTPVDNLITDQASLLYDRLVTKEALTKVVHQVFNHLMTSLSETDLVFSPDTKAEIHDSIQNLYLNFVRHSAKAFLGKISIGHLVEREINAFETAFIEEIILDIAKNELRAITWFGALLGFVMAIFLVIF